MARAQRLSPIKGAADFPQEGEDISHCHEPLLLFVLKAFQTGKAVLPVLPWSSVRSVLPYGTDTHLWNSESEF
jgi:hypothetical protein